MPAPARPPISAWLLLDGSPSAHVTAFQTIAPVSAPKITRASMTLASTMPVPSVFATWRPKTANAMKLKNAAHTTAVRGRSTRVATTVAIEFAASCRPFRKSNTSATAISANKYGQSERGRVLHREDRRAAASDVLRRDRLNLVGDVIALVDDALDPFVELLAIEIADRVERACAQLGAQLRASAASNASSACSSICPTCSHSA